MPSEVVGLQCLEPTPNVCREGVLPPEAKQLCMLEPDDGIPADKQPPSASSSRRPSRASEFVEEGADIIALVKQDNLIDATCAAAGDLDSLSITIAKASFAAEGRSILKLGHDAYEKEMKSRMWSNVVIFYADEQNFEKAESWMRKLDARRGVPPELRAVNAMLRNYMIVKNYDKAHDWFMKILNPEVHIELGSIRPDKDTFGYMIGGCGEVGDLARAEQYMVELQDFKPIRPSIVCFGRLLKGCCTIGQTRRAHYWGKNMVTEGCAEYPNGIDPNVLKMDRERNKREWREDRFHHVFDRVLTELARALSDAGHTRSAYQWLAFLVETGLLPKDAEETWEHVRSLHPADVIPTLLSGEAAFVAPQKLNAKGAPCMVLPAKLPGEAPHNRFAAPEKPKDELKNSSKMIVDKLNSAVVAFTGGYKKGIAPLTAAIAEGEAAGLSEEELQGARAALAFEERRLAAAMKLQLVMTQAPPDMKDLEQAVREAEEAGFDGADASADSGDRSVLDLLAKARDVLAAEKRKEGARAHLAEMVKIRGGALHTLSARGNLSKPPTSSLQMLPPENSPTSMVIDEFPPPPMQSLHNKIMGGAAASWNRRVVSPRKKSVTAITAMHKAKEDIRQKARILYL